MLDADVSVELKALLSFEATQPPRNDDTWIFSCFRGHIELVHQPLTTPANFWFWRLANLNVDEMI